jgi:hypothetical protein
MFVQGRLRSRRRTYRTPVRGYVVEISAPSSLSSVFELMMLGVVDVAVSKSFSPVSLVCCYQDFDSASGTGVYHAICKGKDMLRKGVWTKNVY